MCVRVCVCVCVRVCVCVWQSTTTILLPLLLRLPLLCIGLTAKKRVLLLLPRILKYVTDGLQMR